MATIIYTHTDEAPLLATYSFLPIIQAYAAQAGVDVETRDISLSGRILAQFGLADRIATLLMLLGVVNLFVALFNFVPLLPLDGGHMAGAIYEAVRRAWARLLHRPDPGYADVAQMLPIAYAAAAVLIVLGALLVWADIVAPINLTG